MKKIHCLVGYLRKKPITMSPNSRKLVSLVHSTSTETLTGMCIYIYMYVYKILGRNQCLCFGVLGFDGRNWELLKPWWVPRRCAISAASGGDGRCWPFHQHGETRRDQPIHL
ncbi:hypothetical protein Gohar_001775 [Gossypium harknessii]|uniref:Uncharacterized protein n=1 Tax=Gossypium harknessii TaxID=34285 RepID=A0A7J9I5K1_9ROSI|nr:hypothetical protein [Gossypium harknessii]